MINIDTSHSDKNSLEAIETIRKNIGIEEKIGPFSYQDISNKADLHLMLYFGLSENEKDYCKNILVNCRQNDDSSQFPDFIFDKGLIEHFHITSSKETRKGSVQLKKFSDAEKWFESHMLLNSIVDKKIGLHDSRYRYNVEPEYNSHDFLIHSFEKNWEKHISHLNEYKGCKEIVFFLVDNPNRYLKEQKINENLNNQDLFYCPWYVLSRDKTLLQYIYTFKNNVDYVIYLSGHYSELIKLSSIPHIIESIPDNLKFVELKVTYTYEAQILNGTSRRK